MKFSFKSPFSVAMAIGFGLIVLGGYFFGSTSTGEPTLLGVLRDYFLQGAMILAAVALLVGIGNLASVHMGKIQQDDGGYSFVLLSALTITLGVGVYDIFHSYLYETPSYQWTQWVFEHIQLPIETSLMAVLAISLTYAAARLLNRRMSLPAWVFVGVLLLLLVGAIPPFVAAVPFLADLRAWIIQVPATGGARGILFGAALGTIATGLRILMGSDRPYRG